MTIAITGCAAPPGDLAVPVTVCKVEHLLDILLEDGHRQVPHHVLEVGLREELVVQTVLLRPEVLGVGLCAAQHL